jgi:glycerol-3-phosphate dehydrogenase
MTTRGPLPERVDVVIIGGGVNGVAIARECAQAHRSVLLVEREDFASGTTSRCSRIVEGGLNYLEQGEIGMLRDSLRGREALLHEQSHLVQPLDFVLAAGPKSRYSAMEIRAALWLYQRLGKISSNGGNEHMEALRNSLDAERGWSLYPFHEAQCEFPERLVADWLLEACAAGTVARNHAEVRAIQTSEGRVRGVLVRDRITQQDSLVDCEWIINAAGPWVDMVRDSTGLVTFTPLASGVRGSYLMLRRFAGAPEGGFLTHCKDGRAISITPWNGMIQVGATEVACSGDPSAGESSTAEIEFLLNSVAALFPSAGITCADVAFSYSGVRPLAYRGSEDPTRPGLETMASQASRHVLHNHAEEGAMGMLSIFGGTLSTAASLARKTARTMGFQVPRAAGPEVAFGAASGVENTLQQWANAVHAATGISQESAEAVARWHGRYAMCVVQTAMHDPVMRMPIIEGQPQLVAQAVEAVAHEHAVTLGDILLRRVPMALDADWNEYRTAQAAVRIALALGWSESRTREEIEEFDEERDRFLQKPQKLTLDPARIAV